MRGISDESLFKMWRRCPGWVPIDQLRRLRAYMKLFQPDRVAELDRDIMTRLPETPAQAAELESILPRAAYASRLSVDAEPRLQ